MPYMQANHTLSKDILIHGVHCDFCGSRGVVLLLLGSGHATHSCLQPIYCPIHLVSRPPQRSYSHSHDCPRSHFFDSHYPTATSLCFRSEVRNSPAIPADEAHVSSFLRRDSWFAISVLHYLVDATCTSIDRPSIPIMASGVCHDIEDINTLRHRVACKVLRCTLRPPKSG